MQEQRSYVKACLAELPNAQRLALELAYFGGLSHSEIAAKAVLSLGTVKTRIRLRLKN